MKASFASVRLPHWQTITLSVIAAVLLSLLPLPEVLRHARPDWLSLVVIYWVLALPRNLGVFFGWFIGLLQDIVSFSLFGLHALGKAFIGATVGMASERIKHFNVIEMMIMVFVLQSINVAVVSWIELIAHGTEIKLVYWQSALTTALLWPFVSMLLTRLDPLKS